MDVERALSNIRVSRMAGGDLVHHVPCAQDTGLKQPNDRLLHHHLSFDTGLKQPNDATKQPNDATTCLPSHTQTCTCACVK